MNKVLIVEDVEILRRRIKNNLLKFENIEVFEAECYSEAINHINNEQIDTIFLDIDLIQCVDCDKNKDGLDILDYIKKNNVQIKHIVCTSGSLDRYRLQAMFDAGVVMFLNKPYTQADIDKVLQNL